MSSNPAIFNYLAQQHLANLNTALRCFDEDSGKLIDFYKQKPLPEGKGENNSYEGRLIISDGEVIGDDLINKGIIKNQSTINYNFAKTLDDLMRYFSSLENNDGAHFYDNRHFKIGRVRKFNNNFASILEKSVDNEAVVNEAVDNGATKGSEERHKERILSYLPINFLFSKGASIEETMENIGLKTDLALNLLSHYDNVDIYQLKQTPYGHLGMGLVSHFGEFENGEKGLIETLGFEYAPESEGPFVHDKYPIVAVYTKFKKVNGRVIESEKQYLPLSEGFLSLPEKYSLDETLSLKAA
jgi:hypothetical protein